MRSAEERRADHQARVARRQEKTAARLTAIRERQDRIDAERAERKAAEITSTEGPPRRILTIIDSTRYDVDEAGDVWVKKNKIGHISGWHADSVMAGQQIVDGSTAYQQMIVTVTCGQYVKVHSITYGFIGGTGPAQRALAAVAASNAAADMWKAQHGASS